MIATGTGPEAHPPGNTTREALEAIAFLVPGLGLGGLLIWRLRHRPEALWPIAALAGLVSMVLVGGGGYQLAWEWVLGLHAIGLVKPIIQPPHGVAVALLIEILLGPLWLALLMSVGGAGVAVGGTTDKDRDHRAPRPWLWPLGMGHPPDGIRLGQELGTARAKPYDLKWSQLGAGGSCWGASGSGKTVLLARVVSSALATSSTIYIDGAGPGAKGGLQEVAASVGVPFYSIDPDDDTSWSYSPLSGSAAEIANKLFGGLVPPGGPGEVYRPVGLGAAPAIIQGLRDLGRLTLPDLVEVTGDLGALAAFARQSGNADLRMVADRAARSKLLLGALEGLSGRLSGLASGEYGTILSGRSPSFRWDLAETAPSCAYFSLSALASVAHSALTARLLLADLSQLCARRLRKIRAGQDDLPFLTVIVDELIGLGVADEAVITGVLGLLVMARQCRVRVIVAGQTVPAAPLVRGAILGASTLFALRLTAADSELLAAEGGATKGSSITKQTQDGLLTGAGTLTENTWTYTVHPQQIREQRTGEVTVLSPPLPPARVLVAINSQPVPSWLGLVVAKVRALVGR
jgi:hypothetical protein